MAKTKQDPKEGGGHGPGYTWTQTASEVTISFKVCDIRCVFLLLRPQGQAHMAGAAGQAAVVGRFCWDAYGRGRGARVSFSWGKAQECHCSPPCSCFLAHRDLIAQGSVTASAELSWLLTTL